MPRVLLLVVVLVVLLVLLVLVLASAPVGPFVSGVPFEIQRTIESTRRWNVQTAVGDRIVIRGHKVGEHDRDGEILEVRGAEGGPPYLVRWDDDGHESVIYPGTDAFVQHFETA